MINPEYEQRNQEFNFYLQEIGYECHKLWKEKIKELLNHYPEYANNFAYVYYNQPEEMPLLEEAKQVKEYEVKTEEKHEDFDELMKKYEDLSIDYGHLVDDFEVLEDQRNTLEKNYKITLKNFDVQKNKIEKEKQELENDKKLLEQEKQELEKEINNLSKQRKELISKNMELLKKVKNFEEENKNINNSLKESKDYNKKLKKDYEDLFKQSKIDLKFIQKVKKDMEENKYCHELIISNKNKAIEDKEKYMEKLKKRLETEFIHNRTLTNKFNYVKDFIKKLLLNIDHYKFRLEAEGVDTGMVQLIQEIMEMKNNNSLQISPLYDFCGNTVYIFHNKSMFEDKKNIRIPSETILLSTKGFIYIYNALVEGLIPIFAENGMIIYIPNVKELFSIKKATDHI